MATLDVVPFFPKGLPEIPVKMADHVQCAG